MSPMLFHIIWSSVMLFHTYRASYDSIKSSLKIPTNIQGSAAGYDDQNDIILMFGDYDFPQQSIQFDINNNAFIHHNTSYLPPNEAIAGHGSNYFQLNHTLWILNQQGTHFIAISTHPPYNILLPNITIPILVDNNGCFTMTHNHIFLVGGATTKDCDAHAFVQIYDIKNDEWLSGVPSLPEKRLNAGCYVLNGTLYAIGGAFGGAGCDNALDSILTLNVSEAALANISSHEWQLVPGATLNKASSGFAVVHHNTDLIIVGGVKDVKDVNIFSTITGDCYLAGTLAFATSASVAVMHTMSNTLFVFGGYPNVDEWQYINLPTENPTSDPTNLPSKQPTVDPTNVPTQNPTLNPSFAPTHDPTTDPTKQPVIDPTAAPTYDPTFNPTRNPTTTPTFRPSVAPTTTHPTIKVVVPPSTAPTITETILYTIRSSVRMTSDAESDKKDDEEDGEEDDENSNLGGLDNLAIILIVVCGSLCVIILITMAVGGCMVQKKKKASNKSRNSMLNNGVTRNMATSTTTTQMSTVASVSSPGENIIGEKDESSINTVHVTVRSPTLSMVEVEPGHKETVELADLPDTYAADDLPDTYADDLPDDNSSSNESLFDEGDHVTRGAIGAESMANAINFMNDS